jgi:4-amino-4-deoxy-L-arabinose transferase-like glycosyltransferase
MASTATVFICWLLGRRMLPVGYALAVAASVAVSPILVMHAHYLKEDVLLTLFLVTSLLVFVLMVERPTRQRAAWLGVAMGLAFSAHYKSILLVPLLVAAPLLGATRTFPDVGAGRRLTRYAALLVLAGTTAGLVFLLINWPLLADPRLFLQGSSFELQHAIAGEDALYRVRDFWFTYHLQHTLVPGMSLAAVAAVVAGLIATVLGRRRLAFQDRLMIACLLLFYAVPEASPLKAERYMVPVVPAAVYVAWRGLWLLAERTPIRARHLVAVAAVLAMLVAPLYRSVRLVSAIGNDTRARAAAWLQERGARAVVEQYGGLRPQVWSIADVDVEAARQDGVEYLVASSLLYGRYVRGSEMSGQAPEVYRLGRRYRELFDRFPVVEIQPPYESYAFTNPVIRIVDIRRGSE